MTADRYAGAGRRWAHGATLVYGPIAAELSWWERRVAGAAARQGIPVPG